ncbi:hypothetical protein BDF22DRAFT_742722 [Syncephalis plumigaleata]|nr:hypothetical protein BDF22DRAFT_742722 [Syncephalis plumigaleata]
MVSDMLPSTSNYEVRLPLTTQVLNSTANRFTSCGGNTTNGGNSRPPMHQRSSSTPLLTRRLDDGLSSNPIQSSLSAKSSRVSLFQTAAQSSTRQIRIQARYIAKHLFIACSVPDTVTVSQTRDLLLLRCDLWKAPPSFDSRFFPCPRGTLSFIFGPRGPKKVYSAVNEAKGHHKRDIVDEEEQEEQELNWRSSFGLFCPAKGHWLDNARPLSYYEFQDKIELELHHRSDFVRIPKHLYHEPYAQGYLLIKCKSFLAPTFWKRRWVVLQGAQLYQFIIKTDSEPRSETSLTDGFTLRWKQQEHAHSNHMPIIDITVNQCTLHITAEDEVELRHWYRILDGLDATIRRKSRSVDVINSYDPINWIPPQWYSDSTTNSLGTPSSARSSIYNLDMSHQATMVSHTLEVTTLTNEHSSKSSTVVSRSIEPASSIFVLRKPSITRRSPVDTRPITINHHYLAPRMDQHHSSKPTGVSSSSSAAAASTSFTRPRLNRFSSSQSLRCCFLWSHSKPHRRANSQDGIREQAKRYDITPAYNTIRAPF